MKLCAFVSKASSEATSRRSDSSPAQASARYAARSAGGRSKAARQIRSTNAQRSAFIARLPAEFAVRQEERGVFQFDDPRPTAVLDRPLGTRVSQQQVPH